MGAGVPDLARIIAGLTLGTLGGALFFWLGLPLPWMLGALFVTMLASLTGLPIAGPLRLRPAIVAVIGVLLGARFTPEILHQAGEMALSLAILAGYLVAVSVVVVPFYHFVGRQDWTTAYFAGMPGGLTEMVELGEARGADVPPIILAHSLRIVLTIAAMAFLFRSSLGGGAGPGPAEASLGLADAALMAACAVLGAWAAAGLRLPAPSFLGPLILSAAVHLTGLTESAPPQLVVIAAQVALGTVLGCRFRGIAAAALLRAGLLCLGATGLTLLLALGAGLLMGSLTDVGLNQAMLALAPGGLTEMGLIALAIHADVAFVALHHVVRILIVIIGAPVLPRLLDPRCRTPVE